MLGNREMNMDDYLAALRRRKWVILVLGLLGPIVGIAIAKLLTPSYTSESLVLVEEQRVPASFVKPIVSEDVISRLRSMQEQVLSRSRLQALIERYGLFKDERPITQAVVDEMRGNLSVTIMLDFLNQTKKKKSALESLLGMFSSKEEKGGPGGTPQFMPRKDSQPVTGFTVNFTYQDPRVAQQICSEVTSMFLEENLRERQQDAQGTTDFLSAQVADAKRKLDEQDAKLAVFKRRYLGALPEEQQTNMQVLGTLNTQLSAVTDQLGRAEQDKSYADSMLSQQVATWKNSQQPAPDSASGQLEKQLMDLRQKAALLEGHYTSNYPDLIKTKREIAQLEKQAAEQASADKSKSAKSTVVEKEPPQVQQLRAQLQQDEEQIRIKTKEQERLQSQVKLYESRVQLTPAVEQEYKEVTRDYKTALDFYNDLLTKRDQSAMATDLERREQGEQFVVLDSANLPEIPSFPDPLLFLLGGLGGGVGLGLAVAVALELADKAIRNERDVESLLGIPALAIVPPLEHKKRKATRGVRKAGITENQPAVGL